MSVASLHAEVFEDETLIMRQKLSWQHTTLRTDVWKVQVEKNHVELRSFHNCGVLQFEHARVTKCIINKNYIRSSVMITRKSPLPEGIDCGQLSCLLQK